MRGTPAGSQSSSSMPGSRSQASQPRLPPLLKHVGPSAWRPHCTMVERGSTEIMCRQCQQGVRGADAEAIAAWWQAAGSPCALGMPCRNAADPTEHASELRRNQPNWDSNSRLSSNCVDCVTLIVDDRLDRVVCGRMCFVFVFRRVINSLPLAYCANVAGTRSSGITDSGISKTLVLLSDFAPFGTERD